MKAPLKKLQKVAAILAQEKPKLHFMGLVPHALIPERWDLLISSDQMDRSGTDDLRYVIALLQKHLFQKEMLTLNRFFIMPRKKSLIKKLNAPGEFTAERLHELYRFDYPDQVIVIWPKKEVPSALQTA